MRRSGPKNVLSEDIVGHAVKTVYFPHDRVRSGHATRVTVSLPVEDGPTDPAGFAGFLARLTSKSFRAAMGDLWLEDLQAKAEADGHSLSNQCVMLLRAAYVSGNGSSGDLPGSITKSSDASIGVTFQDSKRLPVFGWYPYVEGFSAPYIGGVLKRFDARRSVYDPFGGSGTTQLAASIAGVPSWYCEINPLMSFIADTKVDASRAAREHLALTTALLTEFRERLDSELSGWATKVDLANYHAAFPARNFFEEQHIRELLGALDLAETVAGDDVAVHSLLRLSVAANAVHASNMTRRADLRRRRPDEYKNRVVNVRAMVTDSVSRMERDLRDHPVDTSPSHFVAADCRQVPDEFNEAFELAITSPPYLNGTNYFRNTKIELWMLGFMQSEHELSQFRNRAVCAGINNVSKGRPVHKVFSEVEEVAQRLDEGAGDKRIPLLVRHYFSDMSDVMASVYRTLEPGGRFVFDIGDSKFYGVHVPTDRLLESIARGTGFDVESSAVLAKRYSRDKSELVQRELVFRKDS